MGGERKKTGGGAMSAVRGTAAALAVTGLLFLLPGLLVPGPERLLVQELAHILFIRLAELVSHNASLGGRRQKVILM